MNKKFILGAGISGLIYKYYHPEFEIISPEVGGKILTPGMKNIVYLHATADTEEFLKDVGLAINKKTQLIKYVRNNEIKNEITIVEKIMMIKKKLDDKEFDVKDTNLSTSDYYISIYEIDMLELVKKLTEKINIIKDTVIRITSTEIITETTRYEYDEIVSTIPANIFWSLYYEKNTLDFKSKDITFVLCDIPPKCLENSKYHLCYFIDENQKYTRVSRRDNSYLYEFTGVFSIEDVKRFLPRNTIILSYNVEKNGILYSNEKNIPPKNIQFLGRFSTWQHSYKINDVISFSKWSYDLRHIWNRQRMFSEKVINLASLRDTRKKEEQTKIFVLHLLSEISEILNELNFKQHKKLHSVNVDNILEESIDTFKYLLNILLVWDIDAKKFIEEFNRKSDSVEKRFDIENAN